ncbi:MAG: hypothetical protein JW744_04980 [Candidatus Diapherotrites archaeon]|uniref:Uncharacterized protein n=1 Tax=Candidatus Iainarchaeum sp. TaxID=3101447 RepID=A0A938YY30_9ARCH|nr:hypothetical protein [Candidatus Diapherotrites archaeon]
MGYCRKAFNAGIWAVGIMAALFFCSAMLGVGQQFGSIFSWPGLFALAFLIFTLIADK